MFRVLVSTDVSGITKRFSRMEKRFTITLPKLTFDAADKGAEWASEIAPLDTGALVSAIGVRQTERSARAYGWAVISKTPPGGRPSARWGKANNNPRGLSYQKVLEYGKPVTIHEPGRKQRYMRITAGLLRKHFPELITKEVRSIIKNKNF